MTYPVMGPTGNDVKAVQDAVDSGDNLVSLSGTFTFGNSHVTITKPVTITVAAGATIFGGNPPFIIDARAGIELKFRESVSLTRQRWRSR